MSAGKVRAAQDWRRFPVTGMKTTMAGTVDFIPVDEMSAPALSERLAELVPDEFQT